MVKKSAVKNEVEEVQRWFKESVMYEGEAYVMDAEQAAAVMDESWNAIVVARAGSGKTRTIVAKIVYLIARRRVKPEEIMAFVFNANAAAEINARVAKMRVNGVPVVSDETKNGGGIMDELGSGKPGVKKVKIATTFHAFARKIVYEACGGKDKCGEILADEKEKFVLAIVKRMLKEVEWREKILRFEKGAEIKNGVGFVGEGGKVVEDIEGIDEKRLVRFAKMMTQFINRAQQKYLGGEITVAEVAREYMKNKEISTREGEFVKLGVECFKRYHWYLLDAKKKLPGFEKYGTDFNLIVSWASKLIAAERGKVKEWLSGKKYILIDEYQDFSQLFLAAVQAVRGVAQDTRLFVVGDDWQAINRFAGSEVEYFKKFEECFAKDCRRYEITTNYRCNREIVDTARKFMKKAMKEKGEFRAFSRGRGKVVVVDPRWTECEYALMNYDRRVSGRDNIYMMMARRMAGRTPKAETVRYVKTLVEVIRKNRRAEDILLLHRNNEMNMEGISLVKFARGLKWGLVKLGVISGEEFDTKIRVMTMHKSKGLEAEVVIILEADDGVIPKTHPDTCLFGVFGETDEVALADQKRLFYVAMTRAKKRLYIIHDSSMGGGFVKYLGRGVEKWNE